MLWYKSYLRWANRTLNLEEVEPLLKRVRIEKSKNMTEKDVEDFCVWVCAKATRLGFEVEDISNKEILDSKVE